MVSRGVSQAEGMSMAVRWGLSAREVTLGKASGAGTWLSRSGSHSRVGPLTNARAYSRDG